MEVSQTSAETAMTCAALECAESASKANYTLRAIYRIEVISWWLVLQLSDWQIKS